MTTTPNVLPTHGIHSSHSPLGNSEAKQSESVFRGFKLSLQKAKKNVQWFFAKLSFGLIRDPFKTKTASSFTAAQPGPSRSDGEAAGNASVPQERRYKLSLASSRSRSLPNVSASSERQDGLPGSARSASVQDVGLEDIDASPVPAELASAMKENAAKRELLAAWLTQRNDVIREVAKDTQDYLENGEQFKQHFPEIGYRDEFVVVRPRHKFHQAFKTGAKNEYKILEVTPARKFQAVDLMENDVRTIFFSTHFEAGRYVPREGNSFEQQLYVQEMDEGYFKVFDKLLEMVGGKKCDIFQGSRIFGEMRLDALRTALEEEACSADDKASLIRHYQDDFQAALRSFPEDIRSNPQHLKRAHEDVSLRALPGMEDVVGRIGQSLAVRAKPEFLLVKMALQMMANAGAEENPVLLESRLPALSPRWGQAKKFAALRGEVIETLKGALEKRVAPTSVEAGECGSFEWRRTPEEQVETQAVLQALEILECNQVEFLRELPDHKHSRTALFKAHYAMPLSSPDVKTDSVVAQRREEILQEAQKALSERLIAACVSKKIGIAPGQVSSAKIERLFKQYFQEARANGLRHFMERAPRFFDMLKLPKEVAVDQFETDFILALPSGDDTDYINGLLAAHRSVKLQSRVGENKERTEQLVHSVLAPAVDPLDLLTIAAVKVAVRITGNDAVTSKILGAFGKDLDAAMNISDLIRRKRQAIKQHDVPSVPAEEGATAPDRKKQLKDFLAVYVDHLILNFQAYRKDWRSASGEDGSQQLLATMEKLTDTMLRGEYPQFLPESA